jgi:hypothetical protein
MAQKDGRFQFQGLFKRVYTYVGAVDVASLADGAGASQTFTVTGVDPTQFDMVIGRSVGVSTAGISVTADVTAADTVTVRFQNESGGVLDLAATSIYLLVGRPSDQYFIP